MTPQRGKALKPNTAVDPLLRQIFDEQERLGVSTPTLARLTDIDPRTIADLRHPAVGKGKRISVHHLRRLAEALDFEFPAKLRKRS